MFRAHGRCFWLVSKSGEVDFWLLSKSGEVHFSVHNNKYGLTHKPNFKSQTYFVFTQGIRFLPTFFVPTSYFIFYFISMLIKITNFIAYLTHSVIPTGIKIPKKVQFI